MVPDRKQSSSSSHEDKSSKKSSSLASTSASSSKKTTTSTSANSNGFEAAMMGATSSKPSSKREKKDPDSKVASAVTISSSVKAEERPALPADLNPNYQPSRSKPVVQQPNKLYSNLTEGKTDDEALSALISMSKTAKRTAVYSGSKR